MARTRYEDRPRVVGGDVWGQQQQPLAPPPRPAPQAPAHRRRPSPSPQAVRPAGAPAPLAVAEEESNPLPLDPGTIAFSLPVAISLGMLDWQAAAGWGALLIVYRGLSRPGVLRGTLDFLIDGLDIGGTPRRVLGVPDQLPRPSGGVAESLWDVPGAIVGDWQAAIRARRGEVVESVQAAVAGWQVRPDDVGDSNGDGAAEGRTVRLRSPGRPVRTGLADLDDEQAAVNIGLPTVTLRGIANADNLWVVGPKGSGKTTLIQNLVQLRRGKHLAIDPHNAPGKWPSCTVIGGGRDYPAIRAGLAKGVALMDRRYKAMDLGEISEEECKRLRHTLVGDEWRSVAKALPPISAKRDEPAEPGAADQLATILTEGRKAGVCVMTASHADTATSMGMVGEKDILKCFDYIIYLGAMAVEQVPAAAQMTRPAVVYDPERNAFAQLVLPSSAAAPVAASTMRAAPSDELGEGEAEMAAPAPVAAPRHAAAAPTTTPRTGARIGLAELYEHAPELAVRRGYVPTPEQAARYDKAIRAVLAGMLEIDHAPASTEAAEPAVTPRSEKMPEPLVKEGEVIPASEGLPSLAAPRITIDRDDGGPIYLDIDVNFKGSGPFARGRRRRGAGVDAQKMRERADKERIVRRVIARGGSANEARREAQLGRDRALELARRARRDLGVEERS